MADETPPFRLEIDEVTRAYHECYDTLKDEVKEYDGAQAEIKRLKIELLELEQQVERTKGMIQAQENKTKLKEAQIQPLLEFFRFPDNQRQPRKIPNDEERTLGSSSTSIPITGVGIGLKNHVQSPSAGAPSPASALSSNVLTDQAALRIIDDVERAHGHKFSLEEIKTIIEQYPHACFKDGELYLRKCSHCEANAVHQRDGSGAHFIQGNIAFIRHMRRHGVQSGLSGKNIDDHCDLGDPVGWEDVVLMSARKEPKKPVVMNLSKGYMIYKDFKADTAATNTKKRASALASACDTMDETEDREGKIKEDPGLSDSTLDRPRKRQRKSNSIFAQGFVPINTLDEDEEELYM